jgi:hypothetical protein
VIRKGDIVTLRPEWSEPGDEAIVRIAAEDEDGGRLYVIALVGLPYEPQELLRTFMLEQGPANPKENP